MMGDGKVVAITAETATLWRRSGAMLMYRRQPVPPGGLVLAAWEVTT